MQPLDIQPLDLTFHSLQSFLNQLAQTLPSVLGAMALLVVGWIIAKIVKAGVGRLLYLLRFHNLAQRSGVEAFLREGGVSLSLTGLLSGLAYWFVMLITITVFVLFMALEQLQISTALLQTAFQLGFCAICLAFALAFGLGGREWAAGILKRMSERADKLAI